MARLPVQRLAPYGLAASLLLGGALTACGAPASAAGAGGASASAAASAASTSAVMTVASQTAATRGGAGQRQAAFQADLQSALDALVKQGTLTATQEQAVAKALEQRPSGAFSRGSATVSRTGTVTRRSGTAGGARAGGPRQGGQQAFEKRTLDPLVQQGTITASQETAVLQAVQQTMAAHRPAGTPAGQGGGNGQR